MGPAMPFPGSLIFCTCKKKKGRSKGGTCDALPRFFDFLYLQEKEREEQGWDLRCPSLVL